MLPKLKISCFLMKRLERIKTQCSGCLFGVFYGDGILLLLGFNIESTIGQLNYEQIQFKFPAEVDLCGIVKFGDCTDSEAHLNEILKDVDITDNPILLHCEIGTLVGLKTSIFMHEKLQEIPYEVMQSDEMYDQFCFSRLKCCLNLYTMANPLAVRNDMHTLRKKLACGSLAFHVDNSQVYITGAGAHSSSGQDNIVSESIIHDVLKATQKSESTETINKNTFVSNPGLNFDIIQINVLKNKTKERNSELPNSTLPAISMCVNRDEKIICIPLDIEAIAILFKKTMLTRFYDVLIESICRSLRLFEQCIIERLEEGKETKLIVPRIFHFFPLEIGHYISCALIDGVPDDDSTMQHRRKKLHHHFGLPTNRPYFRRANACSFQNDVTPNETLFNVHVGLRPSGVVDGKEYLVQGNYRYYHYLQQDMEDKGWGCAYRSLQTICSWFALQGYTESAVPTHSEIQEYLVKIGDKPKSFNGSTQWIGSTEVAMCLEGFLKVDSKIHHITSGREMSTLGPELTMHFESHGTPIMIGGGSLAHTIIGIDYNNQTRQIKFLILDPHYMGPDDLQTIQKKGWCGWKGTDFWDKNSYYNLCMPQRPHLY